MFFSRGVRACLVVAVSAAGVVVFQNSAPAAADTSTVPGAFVSTAPTRLLDTRINLGGSVLGSGRTLALSVLGNGPIPTSGVSAVVLNVTVVAPTAAGYVAVWADGTARPTASNINFVRGQTVPNLVVAPVGADGKVAFFNALGNTQLVADVSGYYVSGTPTVAGTFVSTRPTRLLDTRKGLGGTVVGPGATLVLKVAGSGPVPASGVSAVVLNVTSTAATMASYVTVFGHGTNRPTASSLNFAKGQTVPNLVVAPVGLNGKVDFYNSAGSTQLIADLAGYFLAGTSTVAGTFVSTPPTRLLDTRKNLGGSLVGRGGTLSLQVEGRSVNGVTIPATGVSAVVLNVTVTQPATRGFVTVYAAGAERPTASNLNFVAAQTVANLVVAPVGVGGKVNFYNAAGSTQLIADVAGYYRADTTPPGPVTSVTATPSAKSVLLSWTNPGDDDFAGVLIRRVAPGAATGSITDGALAGSTVGATTSFTDTGVSASTSYTYELFAFDDDRNYAAAARITTLTPAPDVTPPGPVTNLVAAPTANTVVLSWTNPTDTDFAGVTIVRTEGATPPTSIDDPAAITVKTTSGSVTTFTDTGLTNLTQYNYALYAVDGSGNVATAATASPTTLTQDTTPPGPVTKLAATVLNTTVSLSWTNPTDSDFAGTIVCRAVGSTAPQAPCVSAPLTTLAIPKASFTDIGLTVATPYSYSVFAFDGSGNYSSVAAVTATTAAQSAIKGPGPVLATSASNASADALPTTQIDGVAWCQVVVGNTVFVGGSFASARPAGAAVGTDEVARANMLAYNITTGVLIPNFAPTFNGQIRAMAVSPDKTRLYVGGDFTVVNGATHNRIAAFSLSGSTATLLPGFTAGVDATVRAVTATNTAVFVGGSFSTANGVTRTRLAAFQAASGAITAWAPAADNTVNALLVTPDGTKVVVAGTFDLLNSVSKQGIGAVTSVGTGTSVAWKTDLTVHSYGGGAGFLSLSTDGTSIYGSAYVYHGTGNLEGTFSAKQTDGTINWVEDCHGDTYGIFPVNGTVYTVSHAHYCGTDNGWPETTPRTYRRTVAFSTQVTGVLAPNAIVGYPNHAGTPSPSIVDWFPDLTAGSYTGQDQAAWSVAGNAQYVVEGGEFPTVNGIAQQGLVRFAVRSIAPKTSGPMTTGSRLVPTLTPSSTSIAVSFASTWDRDDLTLYYKVVRDGNMAQPVWTRSSNSEFWNLPQLSFVDGGLSPDTQYRYRIYVTDADGNTVAGNSTLSVTTGS